MWMHVVFSLYYYEHSVQYRPLSHLRCCNPPTGITVYHRGLSGVFGRVRLFLSFPASDLALRTEASRD